MGVKYSSRSVLPKDTPPQLRDSITEIQTMDDDETAADWGNGVHDGMIRFYTDSGTNKVKMYVWFAEDAEWRTL